MFEFKPIINAIKNLEWKKYFYKNLAICFLVFAAIFTVIIAAVGNNYKSALVSEQTRYCYEASNNAAVRINEIFKNETDSYNRFINDLSSDFLALAYYKDIKAKGSMEAIANINECLKQYTDDVIDSIYVYNPFNEYIISTGTEFSSNFYNKFIDNSWIEEYHKTKSSIMLRTASRRLVTRNYFTFIRPVTSNQYEGLVAYNIDVDKFKEKISEDIKELYLIDDENNILLCFDGGLIGSSVEATGEKSKIISRAMNLSEEKVQSFNDSMFYGVTVGDGEYTLVTEFDNSAFNAENANMWIVFAVFAVLMIVIAFLWSFWLVMKLYGNLIDLVLAAEGNKTGRNTGKNLDEVAFVKNKILLMLDKNEKIENELANKINLVNKTKMAALQSQLNPHFIHNTLNLISLLDIKANKKDTDASKALSALGDILRYAMDRNSYSVPLSQEIEYAKKYVYIQLLKYKERFEISFDIAEETLNLKVLKMTVQPLIENAVFHGILPCEHFCHIEVKSYIDGNVLKISVTDDGVGISEEILTALKQGVNNEKFDKAHTHGLLNVNQRCMLFYGDEYGCEINSGSGQTEIIVKYPLFDYDKNKIFEGE